MPSFIVKQPNGNLAIFSTVVDDFTLLEATEREALDVVMEKCSFQDAVAKVLRGVNDEGLTGCSTDLLDNKMDGLRRWRFALSELSPAKEAKIRRLIPNCFRFKEV